MKEARLEDYINVANKTQGLEVRVNIQGSRKKDRRQDLSENIAWVGMKVKGLMGGCIEIEDTDFTHGWTFHSIGSVKRAYLVEGEKMFRLGKTDDGILFRVGFNETMEA